MGEAPEAEADDDADGAIDALAPQQSLGDALVAEPVDQADGGQQGGHQQRDEADQLKQGLAGHAGAGEGIGIAEGDADHQRGDEQAEPEGVAYGAAQVGGEEVVPKVREPHPVAVHVLQALLQHGEQGQQQAADQQGYAQQQQRQLDGPIAAPAGEGASPPGMDGAGSEEGGVQGGCHGAASSNSCMASAGQCRVQAMPLRQSLPPSLGPCTSTRWGPR
ncbi:hypothetical protein D3C80_1080010 [compost metagenome]